MALTEAEQGRIIAVLEEILQRCSDPVSPNFSPWAAKAAAERLARHHARNNDESNIQRVIGAYGKAFESVAEGADPLLAMAWLQPVIDEYANRGMGDDAKRAQLASYEKGKGAEVSSKSITIGHNITPEEVEQFVQAITEGLIDQALSRIAAHFIPNAKEIRQLLSEMKDKAPFVSMIPTIRIEDGHHVARAGSVDGCSTSPVAGAASKTPDKDARSVHDLTIVSDVICPWCFVAKKNLEKALELAGTDLAFKITWRPFELNPGMPKEGLNRREYRSKKFGSWEQSQYLDAQVASAGKLAEITFHHELMERTPNTFNAHRLIWLAGEEGVQDAVVEALFRAYFVEGREVGDTKVLAEIAKQAGLSDTVLAAFLEGNAGTDEVRRGAETAKMGGISGVPTFILDGEELFSGAMKPEHMAARLREAAHAEG